MLNLGYAIGENEIMGKDIHCYDAMDMLINKLGSEEFVKLAINSSYFFSADIVANRFSSILTYIKEEQPIPERLDVRKKLEDSQKVQSYNLGDIKPIKIKLCSGGNSELSKIIHELTGLWVLGKGKTFKNFVVSHIWGKATKPEYYSNLWNVVLVPAWADHLLNKNITKGELDSKLKMTYMAICKQLCEMDNLPWNELKMDCPAIENPTDIVPGEYVVNVVKERKEANTISELVQVPLHLCVDSFLKSNKSEK